MRKVVLQTCLLLALAALLLSGCLGQADQPAISIENAWGLRRPIQPPAALFT